MCVAYFIVYIQENYLYWTFFIVYPKLKFNAEFCIFFFWQTKDRGLRISVLVLKKQ